MTYQVSDRDRLECYFTDCSETIEQLRQSLDELHDKLVAGDVTRVSARVFRDFNDQLTEIVNDAEELLETLEDEEVLDALEDANDNS